jgi:DNA polymerase-1
MGDSAAVVTNSPLANLQLHLVDSLDEAMALKRWMSERHDGPLGIDTESGGLSPYRHRLRMVQVGDKHTGWAIPAETWLGLAQEIVSQYDGQWVMQNCFSGDTKVLTRTGIQQLNNLTEAEILNGDGKWQIVPVRAYGKAQTVRIIMAPKGYRTNITRDVVCTLNHRWEIDGSSTRRVNRHGIFATRDLLVGDWVPSMHSPEVPNEKSEAFIHGLIYADGGHTSYSRKYYENNGKYIYDIRLCGPKSRYTYLFSNVRYRPSNIPDPNCIIKSSTDFKSMPADDADSQYVTDFIEGWQVMDGSDQQSGKARCVTTVNEAHAEWLRDNCARGGWVCTGYSSYRQLGGFKPGTMIYSVIISRTNSVQWTIKSIEPEEITEVYCPVVEGSEKFTLAAGIKTCNSGYDHQVLQHNAGLELPWSRIDDTMTLAHLLDTSRPRGLKPLADRLVDPRASAGQHLLHDGMAKQGWNWDTVPVGFEPYWVYSALDPVLTCLIYDQVKVAKTQYAQAYDIEQAATRFTAQMSRKGVRLDLPYIDRKIEELESWQDKAHRYLKDNYRVESASSSAQIAQALARLDVPIVFRTPTGQPRMDKDALLYYLNQYPEAGDLIRNLRGCRKSEKMVSTYFSNFKKMVTSDGRLHSSIHPCQAKTGRMSISDPSLQNLPTDDKLVRGAIIADEGETLLSCDYSQVEMRLAAHFSEDANLLETFLKADEPGGKAFFLQVAEDIFGETVAKTDKRYGLTKSVAYGYLFGAGLGKMAATAGVMVEQMRPVRQAFMDRYPGLSRMSQQIIAEGRTNARESGRPFVLTPTGRRLTTDPGHEYALVNFKIQGHGSEVLKMAGAKLESEDLIDMCLVPVHDEFLLSVPLEQAHDVQKKLSEVMSFPTEYLLPITAEAEILGSRWVKK